jgi:hypothetical protein
LNGIALRIAARAALIAIIFSHAGCSDRDDDASLAPGVAPANAERGVSSPTAADRSATRPDEIYFDLTIFPWYREGRPLVHNGRPYMPQSDPVPIAEPLKEAGRYEGVAYYVGESASEPVYTLYVPVYYDYWQRFTSPPGS